MMLKFPMLSFGQRDLLRDKGTKLGRFLVGFSFVGSALMMLFVQTPAGVTAYFTSLGIPFASLVVYLVILLKIVAGTAIIIGERVGLASFSLIGFTLLATLIAHPSMEDPHLLKNLAIVGSLLYLMAFGPGGSNIKLVRVPKDR